MDSSRWNDILDRIESQWTIAERGEEPMDDVPGGTVAFVEFTGPMGRVRLEFVTKPRTVGERAMGSRRIGSATTVRKVYDPTDMVAFLRAFRWDDAQGEWVEIKADAFAG